MKRILSLAAVLFLAACAASDAPASSSVTGTSWVLQSLGGVPVGKVQRAPTLMFRSDVEVGGSGGCNGWGGGYELKGNTVRFGQMRSTLMACEHGMDVETRFHTALKQARRLSVQGDGLVLVDETGAELARFKRA